MRFPELGLLIYRASWIILWGTFCFLCGFHYVLYEEECEIKKNITEEDQAIDNLVKHLFKGDLV